MTAWFELRPVGLEFLDTAPMRFEVEAQTALSREEVWSAFIDAPTWPSWFPGVTEAAYRELGTEPIAGLVIHTGVEFLL